MAGNRVDKREFLARRGYALEWFLLRLVGGVSRLPD